MRSRSDTRRLRTLYSLGTGEGPEGAPDDPLADDDVCASDAGFDDVSEIVPGDEPPPSDGLASGGLVPEDEFDDADAALSLRGSAPEPTGMQAPPAVDHSSDVPPADEPTEQTRQNLGSRCASRKSPDTRTPHGVAATSASSVPGAWRTRIVTVGLLLAWGVLAGRLVQLQGFRHRELASQAARQRSFVETIPARPGEILDRHGRVLATTITAQSVFVVPRKIANPWATASALGEALGEDPDRLFELIEKNRDRHFVWVKRRIEEDEAERVRAAKLPPATWGFREEHLRRYPQGILAAHVLGLRTIDGEGHGGIEQSLDDVLRGREGQRALVRDAHGRVVDVQEEIVAPPRDGRTVILTLDAVVQLYAERELEDLVAKYRPLSCCAIVLDPRSGDVLAMSSRPTFDPNRPQPESEAAWKNTALASIYEPGSTFKPLVVAWGLDKGLIARDEKFDCEHGEYRMGRRRLHDHHPYGTLNVTDILVKSSNIGMAKIGERLGNRELYDATIAFGFGRPTGIEQPGELSGTVLPLAKWNAYSTGSIPMGQELAVTPLQMIAAHGALVDGGILRSPRLVLRDVERLGATVDDSGTEHGTAPSRVVSRIVDGEIGRWLATGPLTEVVERGTGKKARLADYVVFGKTGTAQKLDPATGGYSNSRHVSSFVCGGPAEDPRVLVLVVVDEPRTGAENDFGGTVAAPAAARILHRTLVHLRVPPSPKKSPDLAGRPGAERR